MDYGVILLIVFEKDPDKILPLILDLLEIFDIALGFENLYDLKLELGSRDIDFLMPSFICVSNLGQHVRNGIRYTHCTLLPARFCDARYFAFGSKLPEANATHIEFSHIPARPTADFASANQTSGVFRRFHRL
jgi:hypothetical protein